MKFELLKYVKMSSSMATSATEVEIVVNVKGTGFFWINGRSNVPLWRQVRQVK